MVSRPSCARFTLRWQKEKISVTHKDKCTHGDGALQKLYHQMSHPSSYSQQVGECDVHQQHRLECLTSSVGGSGSCYIVEGISMELHKGQLRNQKESCVNLYSLYKSVQISDL